MSSTVAPDQSLERIIQCFTRAKGEWTGCDWPTVFGRTGLNLNGLTSRQALLMARATAGKEADDWRGAVSWLMGIEVDARDAEEWAHQAVKLALEGRLHEALNQAREANRVEARYHRVVSWQPLCDAIESALSVQDEGNSTRDIPD